MKQIILPGETTSNRTDPASRRSERFRLFSQWVAKASGTPLAFALGMATVVVWALCGPAFGYSETWQLVINTGTTIITFLMVFVIQNTQYRDSKEIHLKLDELLRSIDNARNAIINSADLSDEELQAFEAQLKELANRHAERERRDTSEGQRNEEPIVVEDRPLR